ncbi:hypothetical protein M011DRAFT_461502 [Sporormia fimetaria CBS 119925]|uniref:Large ribosomal subunit protein mL49 n=1 Tax=Sporormia fimetaria CBS 119925 TaxID=1340428 RepID=A0A6A6V221_9PLEO|nr:hypothetical protein M011DRAFT_461502 [Sporormia fimetaria CBS 119925]
MPRLQPLLTFLRPLGAPRSAAWSQSLAFSTATRLRAAEPAPPKPKESISSKTSPASSTVPATPSSPQDAARAADLAVSEAAIESDNPNPPAPKPVLPSDHATSDSQSTPATGQPSQRQPGTSNAPQSEKLVLGPAKYLVTRSANKNFPVYTDFKRGGNLKLTIVRKVSGDLAALRNELKIYLNKKEDEVFLNDLTKQVIVKGHHVPEVTKFLQSRGM